MTRTCWQDALLSSGVGKPIPTNQRMRELWESGRVPSLSDSEVVGILADYGVIPRNCSIWKDYGTDDFVDHFQVQYQGKPIIAGDYIIRKNALQYTVPDGDNGVRLVKKDSGGWQIAITRNYGV